MTQIDVPCCPVCGRHCGAARWRFRPNLDVVVTTLCRATPRARPQTVLLTAQYRARCRKAAIADQAAIDHERLAQSRQRARSYLAKAARSL